MRTAHTAIARSKRLIASLITMALVVVLVGGYFAARELGVGTSSRIILADLIFSPTTTLTAAVHEVTDAGLQPVLSCHIDGYYEGQTWLLHNPWEPVFSVNDAAKPAGVMSVQPTPLAPANWTSQLHTLKGVTSVSTYETVSCPPGSRTGPVPPGVYAAISPQGNDETARVTFAAPTPYDAALLAISAQALRLANPCREARWQTRTPLFWTSAGQETTYAATHQLTVATDYLAGSSSHWVELLYALPDVTQVTQPASSAVC
ncbi:MAG TPA: hypothetical protein VF725_00075 [Ktedonobacterales bacterium]|jgi:hypothetical protein